MHSNTFIALHIGAGFHSPDKEEQYQNLCTKACNLGISLLLKGSRCVEVVEEVCSFLEDSHLTNAGYGSNFCIDGSVECDAGIMESSTSSFGAVTCLKDVKNPIKLAKILLEEQLLPNKLIPPIILAGDGARAKAVSHGLNLVSNEDLKSPEAFKDHKRYKRILENSSGNKECIPKKIKLGQSADSGDHSYCKQIDNSLHSDENISSNTNENVHRRDGVCKGDKLLSPKSNPTFDDRSISEEENRNSKLHDTIGVICIDEKSNIASGVSSGGIVLKHSGRVGHAAHYGCGCWAFRYSQDFSIGCCTSGCGELLIRTGLAKKAAEHSLNKSDEVLNYNEFIEDKFLNSPYIEGSKGQKLCGLLVVKLFKDDESSGRNIVDFHLIHTSESFCVSFMSSKMKKAQFVLSRLDKKLVGSKVISQGFMTRL